ncbi:MAG TPA: T9SS type A sorting domain-containing protein, partial [Bacteroidota bacterium]|nr:T9SS type A sorting domain-containing protein [Bacteroidota bacterium]
GLGGLYRTTNRGSSWSKISSLDRVTACAINASNPAEAYLTTETSGLWHTTTLTAASPSFALDATYPFRQPERVFFSPYTPGEVWVTSFGGGIMAGSPVTSIAAGGRPGLPTGFSLDQNYPNPFNPSTVIGFRIPGSSEVSLTVYDILGERVATLVEGPKLPGAYQVNFDASRFSSGVYFYRLTADGTLLASRKMLLLR